jgi:hypothetical protein
VEDEAYRLQLAGAKLIGGLHVSDCGTVKIEAGSVYGAAILLPQLARTLGWPRELTVLALQSFVYLVLCIIIHGWLLMFIAKEENVMDAFAGQMYLCDFGSGLTGIGPGGTNFSAARLYSWDQWSTRNYVKSSLLGLFPERKDDVLKFADPGEYGLESYYCRLVCCFVFMVSVIDELTLVFGMAKLLYVVPSRNEPWIELRDDDDDATKDEWLDSVTIRINGMSRFWKFVYCTFVLLPKFLLWQLTCSSGVDFLMETAAVDEIIVNSVALGFLLTMDELVTGALMPAPAIRLLEMCEDVPLYTQADVEPMGSDQAIETFGGADQRLSNEDFACFMCELIPKKLLLVSVLTGLFVWGYYASHCTVDSNGRYVSMTMYLPKTLAFNFLNALAPSFFPIELMKEPYWTLAPADL